MKNQWTVQQAKEWQIEQGWLCGFNYLPRNAVNFIEMWQRESFDPVTIQQELEWASNIGFNTLRTNLPYIVWKNDSQGLKRRIETFLSVCDELDIKVMMTLLDDCEFSGKAPFLGPQNAPTPGVHNSQASASPGRDLVMDESAWPQIEVYVRDIVSSYAKDQRIVIWDLYNEPTNRMIFNESGYQSFNVELEDFSHRLMENTFLWARGEDPVQPLTVAAWHVPGASEPSLPIYEHPTDVRAMELSDLISFHAYLPLDLLSKALRVLETYERPLYCTEWLGRQIGSLKHEQLPFFKEHSIGCYQWGLVKGKTQTYLPWPMLQQQNHSDEDEWFHDLLHADGTPYDESEVALVHDLTTK